MEDQEIWVVDLDSSPVTVSEDGSMMPVASEYLIQETSFEDTPVETPIEEIPAEDLPVEDPVEDTPVEDPAEESPAEDTSVGDLIGEPAEEFPATEQEVTENVTTQQPTESLEDPEEAFLEDWAISAGYFAEPSTFTVTTPNVLEVVQYSDVSTVMVDVVESVLGEYQRMTYTVEEYDTDGNLLATSVEYVPGLAGLDYAWITGAVLFGLLIAGCLKLLGGLIRS